MPSSLYLLGEGRRHQVVRSVDWVCCFAVAFGDVRLTFQGKCYVMSSTAGFLGTNDSTIKPSICKRFRWWLEINRLCGRCAVGPTAAHVLVAPGLLSGLSPTARVKLSSGKYAEHLSCIECSLSSILCCAKLLFNFLHPVKLDLLMESGPTSQKLDFIDALRGLAALMVIVCHVAYIPTPGLSASPWVLRFASAGKSGVLLFFMISAYTLCYSYYRRGDRLSPMQIRHFYLRRIFRIFPLYLLAVLIAWIRDLLLSGYARPLPQTLLGAASIFNPNDYQGLVWASWTLGVELFFYLLFPFVILICSNLRRSLLALGVAVFVDLIALWFIAFTAARGIPPQFAYLHHQVLGQTDALVRFSFLHNLQFFMAGIFLYYLYRDKLHSSLPSKKTGLISLLIGVGLFVVIVYFPPLGLNTVFYGHDLIYGLALFFVVVGCCVHSPRFIVSSWLKFLGVISYSLYLLHPPVIAGLAGVYSRVYAWSHSATFAYVLCVFVTLALIVPASLITFRLVEKPGMSLGKIIIRRF